MLRIKAFYKDDEGYYCCPNKKKFYYGEGKTYTLPKNKVKFCKYGFHCSINEDISNTVLYYGVSDQVHYGLVDVDDTDVIESDNTKLVTWKIQIVKFLPQNFEVLSSYDYTGEWIYYAGCNWKQFDYEKGLNKLLQVDKTGRWIYCAGCNWTEFDYEKGLNKLLQVDKTGGWIYCSGCYWEQFDYEKGLEKLLEINSEQAENAKIYWDNHILTLEEGRKTPNKKEMEKIAVDVKESFITDRRE